MIANAKWQVHYHMLQKNQVHYRKQKQICIVKYQGLKILLFIQSVFFKDLLRFPETILGTENIVVRKTSLCSGGVYSLV